MASPVEVMGESDEQRSCQMGQSPQEEGRAHIMCYTHMNQSLKAAEQRKISMS